MVQVNSFNLSDGPLEIAQTSEVCHPHVDFGNSTDISGTSFPSGPNIQLLGNMDFPATTQHQNFGPEPDFAQDPIPKSRPQIHRPTMGLTNSGTQVRKLGLQIP